VRNFGRITRWWAFCNLIDLRKLAWLADHEIPARSR